MPSSHSKVVRPSTEPVLSLSKDSVRTVIVTLFWMGISSAEGRADLTAQDIITLAQQQVTVPSEFVPGEMKVYSGERLVRFYSFVLGRLWEQETQTEYVRIDFKNAINPSPSTGHRGLPTRVGSDLFVRMIV